MNSISVYAQLDVNLITNPGFESGIDSWPENQEYWHVDSTVSHTGSNSLMFSNTDPIAYPIMKREVLLNKNVKYHITAWIKADNVTGTDSGASIALIFYDGEGKYISGCFPQGIKGTSDWTRVTAICNDVPQNAEQAVFITYLRKGCIGTAWFDDICVMLVSDLRFHVLITDPHYRNTVFTDQPMYITISTIVNTIDAYPINSLYVNFTLKNENGEYLSASLVPDQKTGTFADVIMNLNNMNAGKYRVIAKLIDNRTGEALIIKDIPLEITSSIVAKPDVYIDNQNRCVVDGELFFPIGFFCSGGVSNVNEYIDLISKTNFNCLMNYSMLYYQLNDINNVLDYANQKGVRIVFSVKDCYDGSRWELNKAGPWEGTFNVLKGMVSTYKDHPAILGWYLNDELSGSFLPQIIERYQYISENDRNHPAWQMLYYKQEFPLHADNTDILGVVSYPVMKNNNNPNMYEYTDAVKRVADAVMQSRGIWTICECSTIRYDGVSSIRIIYSK